MIDTNLIVLRVLAEYVARYLSGRDVEIWWVEPETNMAAVGAAFRNGRKGLIQIVPGLSPDRMLGVLVHECAHLRLHWDSLPYLGAWRNTRHASFRAVSTPEKTARFNKREREAEELEAYWLRWASERGESVTDQMGALLYWKAES